MARRNGPQRGAAPGRSTTAALAVAGSAMALFTLASLTCHYFINRPPQANYCGPLGFWLARLLDAVIGKSSLLAPLAFALAAFLWLGRGRHWRKPTAALVGYAGVFLLLSVLSYHLRLPASLNLTGALGYWIAFAASATAGLGAYLVVAVLGVWAANIWSKRASRNDILQSAFILLCGAFAGAFLEYFAGRWVLVGPAPREATTPLGGAVGRGVVAGLKAVIGPVGTLIALVAGSLLVLALFARLRLPELGWLRAFGAWLVGLFRPGPRPQVPEPRPRPVESIPTVRVEPTEPEPLPPVRTEPRPAVERERVPEPSRQPPKPKKLFPTAAQFDPSDFQKRFLDCLDQPTAQDRVFKDRKESEQEAAVLLDKLRQFSIEGRVSDILSGPLITRFEFEPAPGVKIQSIASRQDDISLALAAERIRILAPIPGKNAVGIEVPNKQRLTVYLREVLTSAAFQEEKPPLGFALGTSITGEPVCADLRTMPHILIAGTTGSGKSVCINSIIASIIFRSSPADVRFLTIDPKQLELPVYNPIPHLLSPTTIDPARAVNELNRVVNIMEMRYGEFANIGVRDIVGYNERAVAEGFAKKPYIVVIIDELADLMLRAPTEIEMRITRLAQMSRAVGIHLILATQRPSVDVITGLIKANFPCRIAFQVASKTDSRTILDMNGAESLLGRGDMLFLPPGKGDPMRLHGAFVSDRAAKRIVDLWAETWVATLLNGLVEDPAERARRVVAADVVDVFYDREKSGIKKKQADLRSILPDDVVDSLLGRKYYDVLPEESPETLAERSRAQADTEREIDEKFADAAHIVVRHREASVSMLQRRLDVGWARAGRIIDQLEQAGIVGPYVGSKSRKVLVDNEANLARLLAEAKPAGQPAGRGEQNEDADK
jgi:S-DNA-T family DNA segregation ATPase FtsK/SpoIIIE